jgi:hypothetical protein
MTLAEWGVECGAHRFEQLGARTRTENIDITYMYVCVHVCLCIAQTSVYKSQCGCVFFRLFVHPAACFIFKPTRQISTTLGIGGLQ